MAVSDPIPSFPRAQVIAAVVAVLLLLGAAPPSQPTSAPALPADVQRVLSWLPPDSQTLLVDRNPQPALRAMAELMKPGADPERKIDPRYTLSAVALDAQINPAANDLVPFLAEQGAALVIEGSRHFRAPANLGMMLYEGAHVIVLKRDPGEAGERLMKSLAAKAQAVERIGNCQVLRFQTKPQQPVVMDVWNFYVARPTSDTVVCATNRSYLEELLGRMQLVAADSTRLQAFPPDWPEWKQIDGSKPIWALRHFNHGDADRDPSSPYGGSKPANTPDEQAIGFAFSFDPEQSALPAVRCLSEDHAGLTERTRKHWNDPAQGLNTRTREVEPGVVEVAFNTPVGGDAQTSDLGKNLFLLKVLESLGHGVYL